MDVRPKKRLGQHFLADNRIADKIVRQLQSGIGETVVEIGPGTGVLTGLLLDKYGDNFHAVEVDSESVEYLRKRFPELSDRIYMEDFLKFDIRARFSGDISIVGNFPYNISSQILFRVLEYRKQVKELVGMFQREVGRRICSGPGSKEYGILSVLTGVFYDTSYLFTVSEGVFIPPPKVKSGVIRLERKNDVDLPCSEELFFRIVKMGFNQRRKTLRNSLSQLIRPDNRQNSILSKRPEELGLDGFFELAHFIESQGSATLD